jgi:stage III sporulation protein AH
MKRKKISLGGKGLLLLGLICAGFLLYDFISDDGKNSLLSSPKEEAASLEEKVKESGLFEKKDVNEQDKDESITFTETDDDYYLQYQMEKEKARSQELVLLKEILNNPNATQSGKEEAENRAITISKRIEDENIITALLAAKNFKSAAAFIQDKKVTVVINKKPEDNDVQQIADLVDGVTGIGLSNVIIIPRKN